MSAYVDNVFVIIFGDKVPQKNRSKKTIYLPHILEMVT